MARLQPPSWVLVGMLPQPPPATALAPAVPGLRMETAAVAVRARAWSSPPPSPAAMTAAAMTTRVHGR
eukprot:COSAG01_NODE_45916_length_405_cov_0.539216_1_plen_67_part_10